MRMRTTPILVTGASGYLGGRILAALKANDIPAVGTTGRARGALPCDLTDAHAVERLLAKTEAETIIHCAANVPKAHSDYEDSRAAQESLRMVEVLIERRPAHLVFTSSMTVYCVGQDFEAPVREEEAVPVDALSGYTRSKRLAEQALLRAGNITATILRIPGLFGLPRRGGLLYNAAIALARRGTFTPAAVLPLWAAIHVDDAAAICVRAARHTPCSSRVLNVGYPGPMSIPAAVAELSSLLGGEVPAREAPVFEMNLERLDRALGLPEHNFSTRLQQLAAWARHEVDSLEQTVNERA